MFGCRVNEAERAQIDLKLVEAGYHIDTHSPQVLIINTCAITGKAEREARQLIAQLKKRHPEAKIVITGCSATYWHQHNSAYAGMADLLIPNTQKPRLIEAIESKWGFDAPGLKDAENEPLDDKFRYSRRLLVKIQDGCHRFCSYCIVPYLRGQPQSVPIKQIVQYVNSFAPSPSEVILSAINTESFGKDTGESLLDLIAAMKEQTHVPRIGFGSIHPWSLNTDFLQFYKDTLVNEPRFLPFFHVPLQSCSNPVLKYMNRPYKIEDIKESLNAIVMSKPDVFIATDIIVGFLGETDELFEETYRQLVSLPISRIHVFRFSLRPHTAADTLKKTLFEVPENIKKERAHRLIQLSNKKYAAFVKTLIGSASHALAIRYDEKQKGTRLLLHNQVEGFLPNKKVLPGKLLNVTIKSVKREKAVCELES